MQRTRLAVLLALAFVGCIDDPDIIIEANPPDVVVNYDCPCVEGSCEHVVNITEEFYPTETVYVTEEDTTPDVVQEFYGDTADLPVLLWSGIGEPMPKKFSDLTETTEALAADIAAISQSGTSKKIAVSNWPLPLNYIAGLITSNDAGDTDHDIAIAPGVARSVADDANLKLAAIWTKQIDAAWAVGDDAGGMAAGDHPVQADTLYALWLIKRPDTGVVDAVFSTDFSSVATMPTNYTKKRLIAAVKTDGSANIIQYVQSGDHFRYLSAHPLDVNDSTLTTTVFETGTLSVPPSARAHVALNLDNAATTDTFGRATIRTNGETASPAAGDAWVLQATSGTFDEATAVGDLLVDASSQVEYSAVFAAGTPTIQIRTLGFKMVTRSNP